MNNCYWILFFSFKPHCFFCLIFKTSTYNMHYNGFSIVQLPMCTCKIALTIFRFVYFNIHLARNLLMNFDVFTCYVHIFLFLISNFTWLSCSYLWIHFLVFDFWVFYQLGYESLFRVCQSCAFRMMSKLFCFQMWLMKIQSICLNISHPPHQKNKCAMKWVQKNAPLMFPTCPFENYPPRNRQQLIWTHWSKWLILGS